MERRFVAPGGEIALVNRRTMLKSLLGAFFFQITGGWRALAAQSTPVATPGSELEGRLDAVLAPYAADRRFFGAALIATDGKPVLRKGYGFANPMQKVANTPETGYQIASITKTFTASMIMQLRDEGKLSIDDPASRYLSGYPNLERDGVAVTIKQLLSHTSGVVDFLSLYDLENPSSFPPDLAALIDNIKRQPLAFTPGSDYLYSNSGYLFLGRIIEQITGASWETVLNQRLLEPLGMTHTWLTVPADPGPQAIGFLSVRGLLLPISTFGRTDLAEAAGGITSTVDDLLIWDQALWSGIVVPPATLAEMETPVLNDYGLGLAQSTLDGMPAIGHFGHTVGFRTDYEHIPELNATIIILSNREDIELGQISDALASELKQ
jgi:CubicO group peptidase (beta-lactamase class C family)